MDTEESQGINRGSYQDSEDEADTDVEQVFNLITDSAKNRFDYSSFSENLEMFDPDFILFQIIASLACKESVDLIIAKIRNRFILSGFIPDEDYLKEFILLRKKDLGIEMLAFDIANDSINNGSNLLQYIFK